MQSIQIVLLQPGPSRFIFIHISPFPDDNNIQVPTFWEASEETVHSKVLPLEVNESPKAKNTPKINFLLTFFFS
ncbi:hypothetical protein GCM10026987_31220 [Belliella aquatica]|uniref:Uncharacterized protein n=1 Tax=Belliella aquatica TaxID=1323734 RepID=A0ABQ1MID8_9BACT|nr:hypothetical protein GCM10010993_18020 [Belliella aquatica]